MNARVFPSGDHSGFLSSPEPLVSCVNRPVETLTSQICPTLLFSPQSLTSLIKAAYLPSGDICGELTLGTFRKSIRFIGLFSSAIVILQIKTTNPAIKRILLFGFILSSLLCLSIFQTEMASLM